MSSPTMPESSLPKKGNQLTNDFEVLRQLSLFKGENAEVVKLMAYLAKRKNYQIGDYILREGREAQSSYFLIAGAVELTTVHRGEEIVTQNLREGDFFGELALLARFNWFFNVRASTDAQAILIDRKSFAKVMTRYPNRREKIVEKIIQLRVERLKDQTTYILDNILDNSLKDLT